MSFLSERGHFIGWRNQGTYFASGMGGRYSFAAGAGARIIKGNQALSFEGAFGENYLLL